VYFAITAAGRTEVATWLSSPVVRTAASRDELAIKLAVAVTLPGVDLSEVVHVQRRATLRTLRFDGRDLILPCDADEVRLLVSYSVALW